MLDELLQVRLKCGITICHRNNSNMQLKQVKNMYKIISSWTDGTTTEKQNF